MGQRYILGYLSANDTNFLQDFVNLDMMTRHHPGVPFIEMYIILSEAETVSFKHERAISYMECLIEQCEWISLKKIVFKPNPGRDFSSAKTLLASIAPMAAPDDMVMIRNRSSYGPHSKDWYLKYAQLLTAEAEVGLVGNTINFYDFHGKPMHIPHIQTYVYLSFWRVFSKLMDSFPGAEEEEKEQIVTVGEIGLSKEILTMGLGISSLDHGQAFFQRELKPIPDRSGDHKARVRGLPFSHRESREHWLMLFFCRCALAIKFRIWK